jgi:hypothetical protein
MLAVLLTVSVTSLLTGAAHADNAPSTEASAASGKGIADPLAAARAAWKRSDYVKTERLYAAAIDEGGLDPGQLLEAWTHLGSARAALGRNVQALAAYRQAALVDLSFALPPGSIGSAAVLARQAQKEAHQTGSVAIKADVPAQAKAGEAVKVSASLGDKIVPRVSKVGVVASTDAPGGPFTRAEPAEKTVRFDLPANLFVKAPVAVRFDALDAHGNRLASLERKIEVSVPSPPILATTTTMTTTDSREKDKAEKSGFWSTPWPYIIGGVVLAAGGAALYIVTRPSDNVTVGAASVRVR